MLKYDFLRLCGIFCLSFIHPLGFDWLNFGILSVNGIFQTNYTGTICIFLIAYFIHERYISRYYKIAIILTIFLFGLQYEDINAEKLNLDYKLINTNINQDLKYIQQNFEKNSNDLINEIKLAIKENKELIIMPESAFAFDLQHSFNGYYENLLKQLSYQITIITGAFSSKENKIYNSTYIFKQGNVYTLNKYYLVPFGEEIPFFKDLILKYLLTNIEEFSKDKKINIYKLNNQIITNAICYEATKEKLYKDKNIIIAISNNAWFKNSSEYLLQNLLIKFYASKYEVNVYHSTNANQTKLIEPKKSLIKKYKLKFQAFLKEKGLINN